MTMVEQAAKKCVKIMDKLQLSDSDLSGDEDKRKLVTLTRRFSLPGPKRLFRHSFRRQRSKSIVENDR